MKSEHEKAHDFIDAMKSAKIAHVPLSEGIFTPIYHEELQKIEAALLGIKLEIYGLTDVMDKDLAPLAGLVEVIETRLENCEAQFKGAICGKGICNSADPPAAQAVPSPMIEAARNGEVYL